MHRVLSRAGAAMASVSLLLSCCAALAKSKGLRLK